MERRLVLEIQRRDGRTDLVLDRLDTTVKNLKQLIHDLIKVPVDQQNLFHDSGGGLELLEDERTLDHYMIDNNSVVHLEVGCFISLQLGGQTFLYEDDGTETVENLKTKLFRHMTSSPRFGRYTDHQNQQNVFFQDQVLEDQRTLSSYGVQDRSVLHIEINQSDSCVIITSAEKPMVVDVKLSRTVEDLKNIICGPKSYPVDQVNLIFGDQILEDRWTLSSYGIQHKGVVHLELRSVFILVEVFSSTSVVFPRDLSATVGDLKALISEHGYPRGNQKLTFRDETLEDQASLSSSGVRNGSRIQLQVNRCAVLVKAATGKPNFLQDDLSETVEELKRKIHALTGYPVDEQELWSIGKHLKDEQHSLSSYGITDDDVIHLQKGPFVFVKTFGKTIYVPLDGPDEMVESIKEKVLDLEGIPVDQQRMIFAGKQLEDGRSVADYGIPDGGVLHIVLRLCGGGGGPDQLIRLTDYARAPPAPPQDREGDTRRSTESLQAYVDFRRCMIS